ncbi:hypothetical protein ACB092_04G172200 [Castanea dentata]
MFFLLIIIIPFLHFIPNTAIPHVQPHPNTTIVAPKASRGFSVPLYHRAMLYREEFNLTRATSSNYDAQKTMFITGLYDRLNGAYVAYFMVGDPPQRQALLEISYNSALYNHDENYIISCEPEKDTTITVPLLLNPLHPSHYFVGFQGISLNNQMVPIPLSYWEFSTNPESNIDGGVLVDSGALVSWMPTQVYEIFSSNFVQLTNMIQEEPPDSTQFETCFSTRSTSRSVLKSNFISPTPTHSH